MSVTINSEPSTMYKKIEDYGVEGEEISEREPSESAKPPNEPQKKPKPRELKKKRPVLIPAIPSISAVVMISCLNVGNFFLFNIPEQLANQTMEEFGINQTQLNLMYTFYYAPSIIILIFSSKISSMLTSSFASMITCLIILLGSILTNYGFYLGDYKIILAGRFLFGIGGELLIVLAACLMEEWFKGGKLTLAISILEMVSLMSEGFCSYFTLPIYVKYQRVSAAYILGSFISLGSLIVGVFMFMLDRFKTKKYQTRLDELYNSMEHLELAISQHENLSNSNINSEAILEDSYLDARKSSAGSTLVAENGVGRLSNASDLTLTLVNDSDLKKFSLLSHGNDDIGESFSRLEEIQDEIEELEVSLAFLIIL